MAQIEGTVLYVEDEEGDRYLVRRAFEKEGLETALRMVEDGKSAVDYLSGNGPYAGRAAYPLPSVVLLDLNLPEIHGFDVLKWIRMQPLHSALPVVVFTSSQRDEDRTQAQILGANDFLLKPYSFTDFRKVARELCARWLRRGGEAGAPVAGAKTAPPPDNPVG